MTCEELCLWTTGFIKCLDHYLLSKNLNTALYKSTDIYSTYVTVGLWLETQCVNRSIKGIVKIQMKNSKWLFARSFD